MVDKEKVFISWSGDVAKAVAHVWRQVIVETFDNVAPFMSEDDIGAGERGLEKIAAELAGSRFGVVVVTQQNQHSQWLNYEAGALSKEFDDQTPRVAPSLVDFAKKNDVTGPLSGFQASLLDQAGIEFILVEIAKAVDADESTILKRFRRAWGDEYEAAFEKAKKDAQPAAESKRDQADILDEILTISRSLLSRIDGAIATRSSVLTADEHYHVTAINNTVRATLYQRGYVPSSVEVERGKGYDIWNLRVNLDEPMSDNEIKAVQEAIRPFTSGTITIDTHSEDGEKRIKRVARFDKATHIVARDNP